MYKIKLKDMKPLPVILSVMLLFTAGCYEIMPRNSLRDCQEQCRDSKKSKACLDFCDCIHQQGHSLDSCLDAYNNAPEDSVITP
jgi:hypothetical protein